MRQARWYRLLGSSPTGWILAVGVLGVALVGPWFAPYSPSELVGTPYESPSAAYPLGTDFLGRDVLTRVLWGGRSMLFIGAVATGLAYGLGMVIGMIAGFRGGLADAALMRSIDNIIAFPPIILVLLFIAAFGSSTSLIIVALTVVVTPSVARLVRSATLEIAGRSYVEAALVRGERATYILVREILPNIAGSLLADVGIRFTATILLAAALNFIGLGLQPPAADWALMIGENRSAIVISPAAALVPAALIAVIAIAGTLIADGIARIVGRLDRVERMRL